MGFRKNAKIEVINSTPAFRFTPLLQYSNTPLLHISPHIRRQRFVPITHRRQTDPLRHQTAERCVARPRGDAAHVALVGDFDERIDIGARKTEQPSCFKGKFAIAAHAGVDDVEIGVVARSENFQAAIDQVFDVGRARPDVVDRADLLTCSQVLEVRTM